MHRGASPASPGRLPLSTISSNSTPTAVPTVKPKGFFRNLVSNFAGDDRVPIDPSLYGSTVSSSPKPPVGAKIPKKKRVKKVTDSSKKRKQERRQRGTGESKSKRSKATITKATLLAGNTTIKRSSHQEHSKL